MLALGTRGLTARCLHLGEPHSWAAPPPAPSPAQRIHYAHITPSVSTSAFKPVTGRGRGRGGGRGRGRRPPTDAPPPLVDPFGYSSDQGNENGTQAEAEGPQSPTSSFDEADVEASPSDAGDDVDAAEDEDEEEGAEPIENWQRADGKYNFELDESDPMCVRLLLHLPHAMRCLALPLPCVHLRQPYQRAGFPECLNLCSGDKPYVRMLLIYL